jgi:hypothetical protein
MHYIWPRYILFEKDYRVSYPYAISHLMIHAVSAKAPTNGQHETCQVNLNTGLQGLEACLFKVEICWMQVCPKAVVEIMIRFTSARAGWTRFSAVDAAM